MPNGPHTTGMQLRRLYARSAPNQARIDHSSRGVLDHRRGADPIKIVAAAQLQQPGQHGHFDDESPLATSTSRPTTNQPKTAPPAHTTQRTRARRAAVAPPRRHGAGRRGPHAEARGSEAVAAAGEPEPEAVRDGVGAAADIVVCMGAQ